MLDGGLGRVDAEPGGSPCGVVWVMTAALTGVSFLSAPSTPCMQLSTFAGQARSDDQPSCLMFIVIDDQIMNVNDRLWTLVIVFGS